MPTTEQSAVTLVPDAIHNPNEARHFMKLVPIKRQVRIWRGELLLADSSDAQRMVEIARDVYDPVIYVPRRDVRAPLGKHDLTTHCPLKGDASYFDLIDANGQIIAPKLAWTYPNPIPPAQAIAGLVAFYPDGLRFEELAAG